MSAPSHYAYVVREFERAANKETQWTKIGAVFEHRDGKGFDITLEALPVGGRITLRKPSAAGEKEEASDKNTRPGRLSGAAPARSARTQRDLS